MLEGRRVLAATADVVLFVDESGSLAGDGFDAYEWFGDTIEALEVHLVGRGIGGAIPNRYSMVQFGTTISNNWSYVDWRSANGVVSLLGTVEGDAHDVEDGVEAMFLASTGDDAVDFEFRNNAAVHYVFLTDGGTGVGDSTSSPFGPALERKLSSNNEYSAVTHGAIFDVLAKGALLDVNGGPNYVSDATITFLGGAGFDEALFCSFKVGGDFEGTTILGVDLNADEDWVLSEHEEISAAGWQTSVYYEDGVDRNGRADVGDDVTENLDGLTYEDILANFKSLVDANGVGVSDWLNQDAFEGEIHAFLSWESGGTYWDIDALKSGNAYIFRDLMVADMFDKIARQVADFDDDFNAIDSFEERVVTNIDYMGDFGDIIDWIAKREEQIDAGPLSVAELAKFDLDGGGSLNDADIVLLVESIFRGLMGDATWDGFVDPADLNAVGGSWAQADIFERLLGDLNGDGFVNAADLNYVAGDWQGNVWGIEP